MHLNYHRYAAIAQLVEHFLGKEEVTSSNLVRGSVGWIISDLVRGLSSVGRAFRWQRKGQGFESPSLHRLHLTRVFATLYKPAPLVQWIEHSFPKRKVTGSNPVRGTRERVKMFKELSPRAAFAAILVSALFVLSFSMVTINTAFNEYVVRYESAPISKNMSNAFSDEVIASAAAETLAGSDFATFDDRLYYLLDEVGADDSVIVQSVPNACGANDALACVLLLDANRIQVDQLLAFESDDYIKSLLAHELGHVVTNKLSPIVKAYYLAPFDGDSEYVADCMAIELTGYTVSDYGYTCSEKQIVAAGEIWNWYATTH